MSATRLNQRNDPMYSIQNLPSFGTSPEPFRANPSETSFEKVLSVPIASIPYKQYTFYAALLDSSFQFVSNLDTAGPISAGYK